MHIGPIKTNHLKLWKQEGNADHWLLGVCAAGQTDTCLFLQTQLLIVVLLIVKYGSNVLLLGSRQSYSV